MGTNPRSRSFIILVAQLLSITMLIKTTMAGTCPHSCSCYGEEKLKINCSGRLLLTLPSTSTATLTLDLSNNALGPIINTSFPQMPNLTSIDLSHNALTRLLGCTFSGMLGLKTVRLQKNRLSSLPDSLFTDANLVEHLDISYNMFTQLPDAAFRNARELKRLDISHNHIIELKLGPRFQVPRLIEQLDLSYNNFQTVSRDSFAIASRWEVGIKRRINLAQCRITHIDPGAFQEIPNLNDLDLSGNSDISMDNLTSVVKELETSGLERLSLTRMNISTIVPFFDEVTTLALKFFNASFNRIEDVPANVFSTIRSLVVLDISHNDISVLGEGLSDLLNLRVLNMSSNKMSSFHGSSVTHLSNLRFLDVSHNMLTDPQSINFAPLSKLKYLDVSDNLLNSVILPSNTSNMFYLDYHSNSITEFLGIDEATRLEIFDISDNDLESVQPFLFKGAKLLKLANFSRNSITSLDHRAFLPQSPLVIDLSHNFLESLQFSNWVATQKLYLNHNELSDVAIQTFYGMTGLDDLDLSNNKMESLHEDLFEYLTNLKSLNLSHNGLDKSLWFQLFRNLEQLESLDLGFNNLSTLNQSLLLPLPKIQLFSLRNNKLSTIIPKIFRDLENIKLIDLSNNPFHCSCDLLAFRDWLIRTKIPILGLYTVNSTAYTCQSPKRRINIHVTKWDSEEFECNKSMLYIIIFSSIGIFLIVAGVVGTAAYRFFASWKHKRTIKRRYLGKRKSDEHGEEKKVDRVRMSSREIAEEIQDAIHRKERKKTQDRDRTNGYVPWPGAAHRSKDLDKVREGADKEGLGSPSARTLKEKRENGRKYERVLEKDWDLGDKSETREKPAEISHRPSKTTHERHAYGERSLREGGKHGDYVSSRTYHPERHRESITREQYHRDRQKMERERAIHSDERHGYRHPYSSRKGPGPYIISSSQTMPNRWDMVDVWGGPRGWTIQSHGRFPRGYEQGQRSAGYRTMPVGKEIQRHERGIRRSDINRDLGGFPQGVRFEEQDPRYYYEHKGDLEPRRYKRSQSYNYLPQDYPGDVALGNDDGVQREYESIDQAHASSRIGPRTVSQPYLANQNTSGWL